jgi:hypothetical protein
MKRVKNITYLLLLFLFVLQSCVKDEANIFDDTAAARGQRAVENYRALLTAAENGWFVDYYPEVDYAVGGYAMYWKFTADGKVSVQCEVETYNPANTPDVSEFDVFMEQGPILSFNSYNKVLHYFCETTAADLDGQQGDYEFIVMQAETDQILLKGKKHGNKLTLRRNTSNLDPDTYLAETAGIAYQTADAVAFHFIMNNDTIGTVGVSRRTFVIEYAGIEETETMPYAFTGDGIKLQKPLTVNGVTIQNFQWDNTQLKYISTDAGADVYLAAFFPPGFLRYSDFLGRWQLKYRVRINSSWSTVDSTDIVEIIELEQKVSFRMVCDKIFNFGGVTLTFDPLKGTVSIYPLHVTNLEIDGVQYGLRQIILADNRSNAYGTLGGPGGLTGVWNNDEDGRRIIEFKDNGQWVTYKGASIILRLYTTAGVYVRNYTENIGQKVVFENLVLTKID